jgi:hypothetical protein
MIRVPVTFDAANRKKDRTVKMAFTSNFEVTSEDYMEMDRRVMSSGWLIYDENEVDESDVPEDNAPTGKKSFAQRLYGVLFLNWKQNTPMDVPFDVWRERMQEAILDNYKEKLN